MRLWGFLIIFYFQNIYAHSVLTSPTPRSNDPGLKTGPCGGFSRIAAPKVVQGGEALTITWQEAINHPGRFIISMSMANDKDFASNKLATVIDNQNSGTTPHNFSTSVQIPNVNCDTCTIQLVQSMEENPNAPTYYYSCADIKIVAKATSAPSPTNTSQTSKATDGKGPAMASCALVKASAPKSSSDIFSSFILLLIPLGFAWYLRQLPTDKKISV